MENLENKFYSFIKESINAAENLKEIVDYYADKSACTIDDYFGSQINSGILYSSSDEMSEHTEIGLISDFGYEFELARQRAFSDWLLEKCDLVEDKLIDVEDEVETIYDENIHTSSYFLYNMSPDMLDMEYETVGDSLFEKIFSEMGETAFGQNVNVAAILAGAKYIFINESGDKFFWKNNRKDDLLEKYIIVKENFDNLDNNVYMTLRANFKETRLCETYDSHGQSVGCCGAGCYTLDNSESNAEIDLKSALVEKFSFLENADYEINIEEGKGTIEIEDVEESIINEINNFIDNWQTENESHTEVTAWTYHDSHNFRTVVLENDYGESDVSELEDDEQIAILLQYPGVPHIEGTNASDETEDFIFHFDRWATNHWICEIEIK